MYDNTGGEARPSFTLPKANDGTDAVNVDKTPVPVNDTVCDVAPVALTVTVPVAAEPSTGVNFTITDGAVVVDVVVANAVEAIVFEVPKVVPPSVDTVNGPVTLTVAPAVKLAPATVKVCVDDEPTEVVLPKARACGVVTGDVATTNVTNAEVCGIMLAPVSKTKSAELTLVLIPFPAVASEPPGAIDVAVEAVFDNLTTDVVLVKPGAAPVVAAGLKSVKAEV